MSRSFIEVQFPVSKISKESYKERKANLGQTLTGLGKWWGRKPLILVRAALLGLLMPAGDDPLKDKEIFLKLLSMDKKGLWKRKNKSIPPREVYKCLTSGERKKYFDNGNGGRPKYKKGTSREKRQRIQRLVFNRLSYDQKIKYCLRPEELNNLPDWTAINEHLGTRATNLQELIRELGTRRFGRAPLVGDCFCGGGSIPFEAARVGCDVYASDLNPIAMLLTWASLHINGAADEEIEELREFQGKIYDLADKKITAWGIEHNEQGHRANSYLYCNETVCPECSYKVPLAPSWIIGRGTKTVAVLKENDNKSFDIDIVPAASAEEMQFAESLVTIKGNELVCPHCQNTTPITVLRNDRRKENGGVEYGLRQWKAKEFLPLPDDVFQERLYCIRYEEEYLDEKGRLKTRRYYRAPTEEDLQREKKVEALLRGRFDEWQQKGYIPESMIEPGDETTRLTRERGWIYWHQLFNPRQLLMQGLLMEFINKHARTKKEKIIGLLGVNKCCDWNSKLCRWINAGVNENIGQTFYNQALNTLYNYGGKGLHNLKPYWSYVTNNFPINSNKTIETIDARQIKNSADLWITDPPYADAVNYHELSEFFLAWGKKLLLDIFPEWYTDSKRVLAITGTGKKFNQSMAEIYKNLAAHMTEDGMQIVMFTHQDAAVWADLTMILWSAGLRVTAAWNIATETDSGGLKEGNYVKGTVLLVLRKQDSASTAYFDELYPEVENEVKKQIDSMKQVDAQDDPNFSDADYLLAAYAASLKVLTSYQRIGDIDIQYELAKEKTPGEKTPIEEIIDAAVKVAYDYLIPAGFDNFLWKMLAPEERFYIKGLDFEKAGVYKLGIYQELARGFGVNDYRDLLASTRANQARLKTAREWSMKGMGGSGFGSSLFRNVLAALYQAIKAEDTARGRNWLKNEVPDYWEQRKAIIEALDFIVLLEHHDHMKHWEQEAYYARLLREVVKSDGV